MQMQKVFNPLLVGKTFISPYFPSWVREEVRISPRWWEDKAEAKKYARFLAEGLTIWSTIDIIATATLVFMSLFISIPLVAIQLFAFFAIGCPVIMILGITYGCLCHLSLRETWTVVRDYFAE